MREMESHWSRPARAARRHRWCLLVGSLGLVGTLWILSLWLSSYDGPEGIDLRSYVDRPSPSMPGARMATEELCDHALPCIQAVDSDMLTMRRFGTGWEVSAAAAALGGDTRLAGWIVVDVKDPGFDQDPRAEFASVLYRQHVGAGSC